MSFFRRTTSGVRRSDDPSDVFDEWRGSDESWVFIGPHDDDIVLGAGLLIQRALAAGVRTSMLIATDGRMGYCTEADRSRIVAIRAEETRRSFDVLGVEAVEWLGYPDGDLGAHAGRRASVGGDGHVVAGHTGLQNSFTECFRRLGPTRIFLPTGEDLHPDHKITYQEVLISVFHAVTDIWPELGAPLALLPKVYELAIYCDFPRPPDLKLEGAPSEFQRKLDAIAVYRSQKQIDKLVREVRAGGPVEHYRDIVWNLYSPVKYRDAF